MLQLRQLESGYGETTVIRDASIKIEKGQVVCLLGRNGVGKTTLLKAIMGILPVNHGEIYMGEINMTKMKAEDRVQLGIGYVPQGREIFSQLSVEDNLLLGLEASKGKVKSIAKYIYDFFPILKEIADRRGGDLSGGQQQQLAFARALASSPPYLLLDEPTEGIQPNIVMDIQRVIRQLKEKGESSILLVEHNFDFAKSIGDYFYIMDKGQIVFEGGPDALVEEEVSKYLSF